MPVRISFDEAVSGFSAFIESQGLSTRCLWISRETVTQHRKRLWLFRPFELESRESSRAFYDEIVRTPSSIRIDAYKLSDDFSLAWVEDFGGPSQLLNYGVRTNEYDVRIVNSPIFWWLRTRLNRFRDRKHGTFEWNITP